VCLKVNRCVHELHLTYNFQNEPELFIYPVSTRPDTQKFQGLPSLHKEPTEDEGEGYISHPFCKTWCGEREAEERVEFSFRWTKDGALQTKILPVRRFEESRADVVFPRDKPKEEISLQGTVCHLYIRRRC
jgi:hypothetical protein